MWVWVSAWLETECCIHACLQESRDKLFEDYVDLGGNVEEMIVRYEARHEETKQSKTRWGFRPEKWIEDRHGDRKAKLLIAKKESLGLRLF